MEKCLFGVLVDETDVGAGFNQQDGRLFVSAVDGQRQGFHLLSFDTPAVIQDEADSFSVSGEGSAIRQQSQEFGVFYVFGSPGVFEASRSFQVFAVS